MLRHSNHLSRVNQVENNRHALLIVITIQIAMVVRPCQAEIACYTNGDSTNALTPEFGNNGLGQCTSPTSKCYEAVGQVAGGVQIQHALYRSGCTPCAQPRTFKYDCQVCETPLCNNQRAVQIQANNIVCYVGTKKPGSVFGSRSIFCTDGVTHCFFLEIIDHITQKKVYQAGCGEGPPGCWNCRSCQGSLCNVPDELKGKVKGPASESATGDAAHGSDQADAELNNEGKGYDNRSSKQSDSEDSKNAAGQVAVNANTPDAEDSKSTDLDSGSNPIGLGASVTAALIVTWVLSVFNIWAL